MSGARSRRKGKAAEQAVVRWLKAKGFQARRYLAGDGYQPGDIDSNVGATIEVKNRQTYAIGEWLRQLDNEAPADKTAVLLVKPNGVGMESVGEWWAIMPADRWLELHQKEENETSGG